MSLARTKGVRESKVVFEMSISLDGYVTGPDVGKEHPMGRGGESLHDWMFKDRSSTEARELQLEKYEGYGAVIVGRRMADLGIEHWGEEPVYHAPVFVVTHRPAETILKEGGTYYEFVTAGPEEALRRAREAAGTADVQINGGADIARQYLNAGLVDEVHLHQAPVVLSGGTALFEGVRDDLRLVPLDAVACPLTTHLVYGVAA